MTLEQDVPSLRHQVTGTLRDFAAFCNEPTTNPIRREALIDLRNKYTAEKALLINGKYLGMTYLPETLRGYITSEEEYTRTRNVIRNKRKGRRYPQQSGDDITRYEYYRSSRTIEQFASSIMAQYQSVHPYHPEEGALSFTIKTLNRILSRVPIQ